MDDDVAQRIVDEVLRVEYIGIVAFVAGQIVEPRASMQYIIPRLAEQRVVTIASIERVVAVIALELVIPGSSVQDVVALEAGENIVAAVAIDVIGEGRAHQEGIIGVVSVVIVFGAVNGKTHCEHVVETERRAVRKHQAIEGGSGVRIGVVETRQVDGVAITEVEQHRSGTHGNAVGIKALAEHQRAGLRTRGVIRNRVPTVAASEDIGVFARPAEQDVCATPTDQNVIAAVALQGVVARATVEIITTLVCTQHVTRVIADQHIVARATDKRVCSGFTEAQVIAFSGVDKIVAFPAEAPIVAIAAVNGVCRTEGIVPVLDAAEYGLILNRAVLLCHEAIDRPVESVCGVSPIAPEIVVAGSADDEVGSPASDQTVVGTPADQPVIARAP